jgi:hypothetical protein
LNTANRCSSFNRATKGRVTVKPSKILCARCRKTATLADAICTHCGGRIIKICGACSFELSAAKRYCDACGEPQLVARTPSPLDGGRTPIPPNLSPKTPLPQKLPKPHSAPPEENAPPPRDKKPEKKRTTRPPLEETPKTMVRRTKPPKEQPPAKKERKQPPRRPAPDADPAARFRRDKKPDAPRRKGPTPSEVRRRPGVASLILPMVLLLLGGGLYAFWRMSKRTPERMVLQNAGRYLAALKAKENVRAHKMLSTTARASVSPERFAQLADDRGWSYSGLEVKELHADRAFLQYNLKVNGQASTDWMHFVLENGKWRRAYWWHLQPEIEKAMSEGDADQALLKARTATAINPYSPSAYGYECEAAYAAGDPGQTEAPCLKALTLSKSYPSRLGPDGLFRLRAILADTYRNGLERNDEALKLYDELIGYPRLAPAKHCALLLARADLQVEMGEAVKAIQEYKSIGDACRGAEDRAHILRTLRILTGQGRIEAVQALQRYHMPGDQDSLLTWRKKAQKDLARRLKTGAPGEYDEEWLATHKDKGIYNVSVRDAGRDILTASVNLWSHDIKVKIEH